MRILGDFHFHSLHSDCHNHQIGLSVDYHSQCGINSINEMIAISKQFEKLGYQYIAVTNHATDPVSTKQASKKELDNLLEHLYHIKKLNHDRTCAINVLAGAEVDIINSKGELSVPDEILKKLDIVVVSNHRPTEKLKRQDIKNGFLNAIKNPYVDILGHFTRFIYNLTFDDWVEIISAAAKYKKIIEYNLRSPLSEKLIKIISAKKVLISIGSDTHPEVIVEEHANVDEYIDTYFKKATAAIDFLQAKAIKPERIINTYKLEKIKKLKII